MQKEEFLLQHNITDSDLKEAKIGWEELELIVKEYEKLDEMNRKFQITVDLYPQISVEFYF